MLLRLPELVNESVAKKWMDTVLAKAGSDVPPRTVFLPFHDNITAHFDASAEDTAAASAIRKLKLQYPTRAGRSMEVGVIRDRPLPSNGAGMDCTRSISLLQNRF